MRLAKIVDHEGHVDEAGPGRHIGEVGMSPRAEGGLVDAYKAGLQATWGVKKFNLDDLFVRFFRIAERRIAEMTGQGIVAYICNYSWLALPSFTVKRQSLTRSFERMWIENMHGDRTITKYGPDGRTSETVFAVDGFSAGIRQGVATVLMVRTHLDRQPEYRIRNTIDASRAAQRRVDLLASLDDPDFDNRYERLDPTRANRYLLRSYGAVSSTYADWPSIGELARVSPLPGMLEKRGGGLIGLDRDELAGRMQGYLDPTLDFQQAMISNPKLAKDRTRYEPIKARQRVM